MVEGGCIKSFDCITCRHIYHCITRFLICKGFILFVYEVGWLARLAEDEGVDLLGAGFLEHPSGCFNSSACGQDVIDQHYMRATNAGSALDAKGALKVE